MEKIKRYWNKPSRSAYLFIAPSIVLLILFSIIPLIMAFGLSFFDVPITMNHATFIGWDNFVEAFHDPRFINSLKVTVNFYWNRSSCSSVWCFDNCGVYK